MGEARGRGSLHSDVWTGSAEELAEAGHVVVFPVAGWWKDQDKRDRSKYGARYSLIVSIETDAQTIDLDLWTPVALEVGLPIKEEVLVEW